MGFVKQSKQVPARKYALRNEQFNIICSLVLAMSVNSPVLSIDCKKKERLGNFYRRASVFVPRPSRCMIMIMNICPKGK